MNEKNTTAGSTQQISNLMFIKLVSKEFNDENIESANQLLNSIILLRDGGEIAYKTLKEVEWGTDRNDENQIVRQGISVHKGEHFLSDILIDLMGDSVVTKRIKELYPNLNNSTISALPHLLYRLMRNLEFDCSDNKSSAKNISEIDLRQWNQNMQKYLEFLTEEYDQECFE